MARTRSATKSAPKAESKVADKAVDKDLAPWIDPNATAVESKIKVTVQRNKEDATTEERVLEVHNFATAHAMVKVHHGCTRQIADYDYMRCDIEVYMPCYREEVRTIMQEISDMVFMQLESEVKSAFGEATNAPNYEEESEADGEEEEGEITLEELEGMSDKDLLALAVSEKIKLSAAQKKDASYVFNALCGFYGIELADAGEEEEAELTFEDVSQMGDKDLLALAVEHKVKLTAAQKKDMDVVFNAVCEALGLEDGEAEEEADGEEEAELTYDEVAGMDDADLLALAKDLKVKLSATQKKDMDFVFNAVCDSLGLEEGEEGAEEEDDGEALTAEAIDDMDLAELLELVDELAADEEDPVEVVVPARAKKNVKLLAAAVKKALEL